MNIEVSSGNYEALLWKVIFQSSDLYADIFMYVQFTHAQIRERIQEINILLHVYNI